MSRTGAEIRSSESQAKFIQGRITDVEKHFGGFCQGFAAYVRKLSKLRDKGDELARAMMTYAEHESFNPTTKSALKEFAENFSGVQDYRETEINRLERKVVGPLTEYGNECKRAKERLKQAFASRNKELKGKKTLDKVRDKDPSNSQQIHMAETDLQRASVDASRASKHLEEEIDGFEKKKLTDIKKILHEFVSVELLFHAKTLEMYTECYHSIGRMSEEEDLEEFRQSLRPNSANARLEKVRSGSKASLNSTGISGTSNLTPSVARRRNQPPTPSDTMVTTELNATTTTNRSSMYSDDMDDYEDEEEEEEEETEEESEDEDPRARNYQNHRQ